MLPGELFRSYFVLTKLGAGSLCEVWLAFDVARRRFVAIKTLLEHHANVHTFGKRLQREANVYQALDHERIIRCFDHDTESDPPYIVLEFLRGIPLSKRIRDEGGSLFLHEAVRILEDVAEGLAAAHDQEIIHRDVRPDNIYLDREGDATLFDFGLAYAQDDLVQTKMGDISLFGTYACPEQITGSQMEARSDLYTLGIVFYEMATGKKIHQARTVEQFYQLFQQPVTPPSSVDGSIPPILDSLVLNMLRLDINQRYPSCRAMLQDLHNIRLRSTDAEREKIFGKPEDQKLGQAKRAFEKGSYEETLKICQGMNEQDTERKACLYNLIAKSAARMKRPDIALKFHEKAAFLQQGKLEYAMDYFVDLIETDDFVKARHLLAQDYRSSQDKEAVQNLARLLDRWNEPDLQAVWNLAPEESPSLLGKLKSMFLGKKA